MRKILTTALIVLPCMAMAATPLWLRDVKISPDGRTIAFQYKGNIWTVPTAGGQAVRVTDMPGSYQATPVWSPDGKQIAFSSDRHGNFDVFIIPAQGGQAKRLTFNSANETPEAFSADGKKVLFSASIQDPAKSAMFPMGTLSELYSVPVTGGATVQVLGTPALRLSNVDKNGSFLYQDRKGFEDEWRKHHTSSVTRDIWRYDAKTGKHTNLTNRPGEDRDPNYDAKQGTVYLLSERNGGTFNVYSFPLNAPDKAVKLTNFTTHPVRFLSRADNGTMAFTYDGEIYTMQDSAKPVKVKIDVLETAEEPVIKSRVSGGARDAVMSPDGKSVVFTHRGDVFVTSVEYNTTKQITATPQAESDPTWSKDGKTLYYCSERTGTPNIWQATYNTDIDPDWANATVITEKPVFKNDGTDRRAPQVSPDGKKLAFIADRNKLSVMDLKSKSVKQVTDGSNTPSRTGYYYTWSPDSKWIALSVDDKGHYPYSDPAIVNIETGRTINLANSGYMTDAPRFVMDGNAVLYASEKYGMRNHASWGSQMDAMLVFLNRKAYDKFLLNKEDYELYREAEKKTEKKEKEDADKDKKDKKKKDEDQDAKAIVVEQDGLEERTIRLTPMSTALSDLFMTADGETLYYMFYNPDGKQLWKLSPRKDEHRMVTKLSGASGFSLSPDGKNVLITGTSLRKFDPKSDKLTPITFSSSMTIDGSAEREYMFDYVDREEGARFYNAGMHGIDWPAMTKHYRKFLPYINNNYDFAELLSELLGELNASHTGGRYRPMTGSQADRTAQLGLLYDLTYTGDGMKIEEVLTGGPFDRADSKIKAGDIVTAINGKQLKAGADNTTMFTDLAGKKTLVTFKGSDGKEFSEVVKPISNGTQGNLLYKRWVRNRAADVKRWSNGRLGYVHIESMSDDSFRPLYSDVLGKYNNCDGIVIDIRGNGGGRMHEDIEIMFTGQKYLTQEIRGTDVCDMPSRRWNKPSIMVMSEACYSNAHGTPWVYKHQGIGKLVGAQVPGTMTSVNWVTLQDPTLVFGIPAVGYRTAEGTYLENSDLDPDIPVLNEPEVIVTGEDQQLHRAVDELLRQIDSNKK